MTSKVHFQFLVEYILNDIGKKIIELIERKKRLPSKICEKTHLYFDLGIDSLAFVEFLLEIEQTFSIIIEISEMESCLLVGSLIANVKNKMGNEND